MQEGKIWHAREDRIGFETRFSAVGGRRSLAADLQMGGESGVGSGVTDHFDACSLGVPCRFGSEADHFEARGG